MKKHRKQKNHKYRDEHEESGVPEETMELDEEPEEEIYEVGEEPRAYHYEELRRQGYNEADI